ncbi:MULTISPECIES: FMN-binding negative transcriptional regulator [Vibrio]|uniref:FMN-binding negative transcriptional regulator n=1 Tax=Vibrio TaxID=662 RepID=UPI000C851E6E|nr:MULTISPECIES: FMN-binding negative transcriptional regulator [Vibrio]PMO48567.1 hypothetical protein BCT08_07755 [Vibrio splendidus]TCN86421.1 PaiB family negative transcriptional regulator [Vibrio crassostreae]TVU69496.1 FMN-binding negative transcriptional regulator [Vibrio tasmaniensis]
MKLINKRCGIVYSYISDKFNVTDREKIREVIEKNSFATLITSDSDGDIKISHLPIVLEKEDETEWEFSFHLSNNNGHIKSLDSNEKSILIVKGPHSYINASWYKNKPAVPTWNYIVAHFEGKVRKQTDAELAEHLIKQVNLYEPTLQNDEIMPEEFVARLSKLITGYFLKSYDGKCKFKVGQNRKLEDYLSVKENLSIEEPKKTNYLFDYMK